MFGGLHSPQPLPSPDALVALAREFTPRVEAESPSPVLLDLAGLGRLWPTPDALGQALVASASVRAIRAHVALAFSRVAALVLARSRPGLTVVPPGREADELAPLPIEWLALPAEREELLKRWGLRTIGAVARLPQKGLAERFGPDGPRLVRLARGEDDALLVRTPLPERFLSSLELDWAIEGLEPFAFLLLRVLEPLCRDLAARGRKAASLTVALQLADGTTHTRTLRPALPSVEPRTWRALALVDLEAHPPRDAITQISVCAEPVPARETQFSLLDPALPSPERLAETLARLSTWTSGGRSGAPQLADSHRPGAFTIGSFAPGPLRGAAVAAPPRLALRAFRPPRPAHVVVRSGRPAFVSAPGVHGPVVDCAGPWRASGDWWDVAFCRDEWDVRVDRGGVFRLFQDRLQGEWYAEGELD